MFCNKISRHILTVLIVLLYAVSQNTMSNAQTDVEYSSSQADIDPRLIEIVEAVKVRATDSQPKKLRQSPPPEKIYPARRIKAAMNIRVAAYSKDPAKIRAAIQSFDEIDKNDVTPSMRKIVELYVRHADLLENDLSREVQLKDVDEFKNSGSWIEKYFAIQLSRQLYVEIGERQAAFQKAQYAFRLIPKTDIQTVYIHYAKADTALVLAQLHNLQGNVDFAVMNSLEYLSLTKGAKDAKSAIDILNNLIFSHAMSRDQKALLYLSEQLLEIEKISSSTVPGLSEFRVSQAENISGNFEKALHHASLAAAKAQHPQILLQTKTNQAIALAGLGQKAKARQIASNANINLDRDYLLNTERRRDVLYLGFLLAQGSDEALALQLYNRQLDVTAQKFLENSSRDTTAMVAELENSRERQIEREAAAAREAELQAMTIDRQRNLNRMLIVLLFILGVVAIASFLFMKYREKVLRELEVKTIEAASAEKLKTEFLGMISHELRTPLNGIIGISDFLANYHEDPDIREKTGIVLRSGNELLSVVESLTDMARLDAGQLVLAPHDTDLSVPLAAVPEAWADHADEKGLAFTHFIDPSITHHSVDEDRLVQCLNILLANAIRFTESGRVHLHITGQGEAQGGITHLTAIIADTGLGMSELVQSRLFTPFMQADTSRKRSHMGTGLSLAIAYALAEMMGGSLSVISREGRGSEFKLDIPLAPATGVSIQTAESDMDDISDAPQTPQESKILPNKDFSNVPVLDRPDAPQLEVIDLMQPHGGFPSLHDVEELVLPTPAEGLQRILVVDDMDSNRDILRLILEMQGHACSEAADGFAALAALDKQTFDLIVLDIHMTPLDGVETLRRIRGSGKAYADIPVVALTADNAASTNAACMEAGADLFLTKPVRQDELLRAISYLNQTEGARILSQ